MNVGNTTCPICEELSRNGTEIEIIEMLEERQYFFPEHTIKIKFCPVCGKELKNGKHSR
jgi:hypothetical protein